MEPTQKCTLSNQPAVTCTAGHARTSTEVKKQGRKDSLDNILETGCADFDRMPYLLTTAF